MDEDKLRAFSVEEICERLGLHRTTVQKLLRQGRLKGFKIGRIWKIPALALDEFLRTEAGLESVSHAEDFEFPADEVTEPETSADEFAFIAEPVPEPVPEPVVESELKPRAVEKEIDPGPGKKRSKQSGKGFSAAFSRRFPMGGTLPEEE